MSATLLHKYQNTIAEAGSGGGTGIVGPNEWNDTHQLYLDTNAQTGTTYTLVAADDGALVTFNNASAIAVTLPQAVAGAATIGSALGFYKGWFTFVKNLGAGTVTITPTTSTINGAATLVIATNQGAIIFSDGVNYTSLTTRSDLGSAALLSAAAVAQTANNLSDIANAVTARANIGAAPFRAMAFNNIAYNANASVAQEFGATGVTLASGTAKYSLDMMEAQYVHGAGTAVVVQAEHSVAKHSNPAHSAVARLRTFNPRNGQAK